MGRRMRLMWLCVSDTAAVEQVMFGLRGAFNSLAEGTVVADSRRHFFSGKRSAGERTLEDSGCVEGSCPRRAHC